MKQWHEIQGWFDYGDVFDFLVSSVCNEGIFVECGAWLGSSSAYLCDAAGDRIRVFVVDTWKGSANEIQTDHILATQVDIYPIFLENMGDRKFVPIRKDSIDASKEFQDNSCDVVYIDMDHSYESVMQDLIHWYPKVKIGGYIAGHDFPYPGVSKAVTEFFKNKFDIIGASRSCWIHKKEIL